MVVPLLIWSIFISPLPIADVRWLFCGDSSSTLHSVVGLLEILEWICHLVVRCSHSCLVPLLNFSRNIWASVHSIISQWTVSLHCTITQIIQYAVQPKALTTLHSNRSKARQRQKQHERVSWSRVSCQLVKWQVVNSIFSLLGYKRNEWIPYHQEFICRVKRSRSQVHHHVPSMFGVGQKRSAWSETWWLHLLMKCAV